jgi:hypothetical protein
MKANTVVAIIRTAGERSFEACRDLLLRQVSADAVEVVCERPFENALVRTYQIGIKRGARWTMTLDADVLLRDGAVTKLIQEAEALPENYVEVQGLIHDKLTGEYRSAGHRIYRTRYLKYALSAIPPAGKEIRPETATLDTMRARGFPNRKVGLVVGIHDYEQYSRDVYRKAFVHANKFAWLAADLIGRWKRLAPCDGDFKVALRGLYDGWMFLETVTIDVDAFPNDLGLILRELNLAEKNELPKHSIDFAFVERVLAEAGPPPPSEARPLPNPANSNNKGAETLKFQRYYKELGPLRLSLFLAGVAFHRFGEALKHCARGRFPPFTR